MNRSFTQKGIGFYEGKFILEYVALAITLFSRTTNESTKTARNCFGNIYNMRGMKRHHQK